MTIEPFDGGCAVDWFDGRWHIRPIVKSRACGVVRSIDDSITNAELGRLAVTAAQDPSADPGIWVPAEVKKSYDAYLAQIGAKNQGAIVRDGSNGTLAFSNREDVSYVKVGRCFFTRPRQRSWDCYDRTFAWDEITYERLGTLMREIRDEDPIVLETERLALLAEKKRAREAEQ